MPKYALKYLYFVMMCLLAGSVYSCKEVDEIIDGPVIDEKEVEKTLNSASVEWGASLEKVSKHMDGYSLVTSQNNDFLLYSDKQRLRFISYKFKNDSLFSTLILMPQMAEDADIGNFLRGYSFVGELDNTNVYQNYGNNTLACTYETEKNSVKYQAVGFTPINSTLLSTLSAIVVSTGDVDNIKYNSVTISGNIAGVTSKVSVGVFYDTDKNLPASTRKNKTTTAMEEFSLQITSLKEQTTYYYQMYAVVDNIYYYGEIKSFTTAKDIKYQIGDLYPNSSSPIGVVFYTASSGRTGKIVSLDYVLGLAWDSDGENSVSASCSNTTDGSNNKMPEASPVAIWVAKHGTDWYCPSRGELVTLNSNLSKINSTLMSNGYSIHQGLYWTSTQYNKSKAYFVCVSSGSYGGYNSGKYGNAVKDDSGKRCCAIKKF